jgi:hypothetical protein
MLLELEKQNLTTKADISTLPESGHLNFALTLNVVASGMS